MTKKLKWSVIILSLIGIFDTAYLSYARFTSSPLSCGSSGGCNAVAASEYSAMFGVPLAYAGLLFYMVVFVLGLRLFSEGNTLFLRKFLFLVTSIGFLSSAYFVYVQAVLIEAFCIYCLVSAVMSVLLFLVSLWIYREKKVSDEETKIAEY
jgi:uncharacterized membrane protein